MSSAIRNLESVVMARCDELAGFTEEPGRLTRRFATPALRDAGEAVAGWMREAGMTVRRDAIGNVIGRREGGPRTLLLGSHLDTVPNAGRYDGMLGVLVAIAAVQAVPDLPYSIEVYGFADEEGTRFRTAYLGSGVVAGRFDASALDRVDADGVTMAEAIRAFGGDPAALADAGRDPVDLLGYVEVHIEQGPVLEAAGAPLGVVTGIAGQTRAAVTFEGEAGHAGTVPMALRRDALAAAAEWIVAVEAIARETEGLVATVGELGVEPGASNVIPSRVTASLDVRHLDDEVRVAAVERIRKRAERIAGERGGHPPDSTAGEHLGHPADPSAGLDWRIVQQTPAALCDPSLTHLLARAVGGDPIRLPSGAGHDAAVMSTIAPVAMLFVRCAGGISHHPDESVTTEDVGAAIEATTRFLRLLG
jgi:allantoate deiminase